MAQAVEQPVDLPTVERKESEGKRKTELDRQTRQRLLQDLELQKEYILSQRTSSPARRAGLEAALAAVEAQIEALG